MVRLNEFITGLNYGILIPDGIRVDGHAKFSPHGQYEVRLIAVAQESKRLLLWDVITYSLLQEKKCYTYAKVDAPYSTRSIDPGHFHKVYRSFTHKKEFEKHNNRTIRNLSELFITRVEICTNPDTCDMAAPKKDLILFQYATSRVLEKINF